jgi:ABC-type nitrate/sulfonate/bicarbonate transport system substrate-binding protein
LKQLTLRVGGVPEHFNLPWQLACEQDLFDAAGAHVVFTTCNGGTGDLATALDTGELDMAMMLLEGALRRILNGGAFRIVKCYTDTPLIWGIHVAGHSPLRSMAECRGQRYAISRFGSGSHLIAIVDAAERGWSAGQLQFVEVGGLQGAREALATQRADVFLWERFMTKPLVDRGEFRLLDQRVVPWPAFVVAVREPVLQYHASTVRSVLQLATQACQQLKRDPAAAEVIAARFDLRPADARRWLDQTEWSESFAMPGEAIRKACHYLKLLGLLTDPEQDCQRAWYQLPS